MPLSPFQQKKIDEMKDKAFKLYQQGFTTREVAKMLAEMHGFKRTYAWVALAVRERLSTSQDLTKKDRRVK